MDFVSYVVNRFPIWNAGGFICFAGVSIWLLSRIDELTRKHIESQRQWWGSTSTFESELRKVSLRGRVFLWFCIIINLFWAIVIVCAHVLV